MDAYDWTDSENSTVLAMQGNQKKHSYEKELLVCQ
jgi:hypothetical protein